MTDGIEQAVAAARAAAGPKDVLVAGGADVVQQALRAGLVDAIDLHIAPLFLGRGTRLFDGLEPQRLEIDGVVSAPRATHVRYRLV